jgi:hypothetical protein
VSEGKVIAVRADYMPMIYNDVVRMTHPGFSIVHIPCSVALQGGLYMGVAA